MDKIKSFLSGHSSEERPTNETHHHGTLLSEATTDQEGRKLSTGYPGTTQDTEITAPVEHSGTTHGSGEELGSSAAAKVTPGFANDSQEKSGQSSSNPAPSTTGYGANATSGPAGIHERSFPLSSNPASSTTGHSSTTSGQHLGHDTTTSPISTTTGNTSTTGSEQHLGRDSAVTGAAGTVGTGIYQHQNRGTGTDAYASGISGSSIRDRGTSTGGHQYQTRAARLLDPAFNSTSNLEEATSHSKIHGGGAEQADHDHSPVITSSKGNVDPNTVVPSTGAGVIGVNEFEPKTSITTGTTSFAPINTLESSSTSAGSKTHHREAAVIGGAGVAAAGAYAANKHSKADNQGTNIAGSGSSTVTGQNALSTTAYTGALKDHHLSRDAAVVGGVGSAAYAAEKHLHSDNTDANVADSGSSKITGHNAYGTGAQSGLGERANPTTHSVTTRDHHVGRDTAIAGGIGGAAYAADQQYSSSHTQGTNLGSSNAERRADPTTKTGTSHPTVASEVYHQTQERRHDKDLSATEKEAKKEAKHAEKEHRHAEKEAEKEAKKEHQHETARNTVISTGAVGTGVAAHEANKHRNESELTSTKEDIGGILHGDRNHGVSGSSGFPGEPGFGDGSTANMNRDWRETVREAQESYGIGGKLPLDKKPVGSDYGDHLHGNRNRGVVGTSGLPGTEGFGSGKATGPGVGDTTGRSISEASTDQTGRALPIGHSSNTANSGGRSTSTHLSSSNTTTGSHVPTSSTERSNLVGEGRNNIDSNSGVSNAGHAGRSY